MRRYWFPKPYADAVARLRVAGGFILVAAFLGLAVRAWAAGHLAKNECLATTGPYAYVRNPLYLGTLIVAAGFVIAAREPLLALLFAAVFVLIYLPVIELEEQHLRELFPHFDRYASDVPLLLPRLTPIARGPFRGELYVRNQEYQALLGYVAGATLLVWKVLQAGCQ
jgi:protein-S-isoprenylcysteine O-methyltransferase Ste14